LRDSHLTQQQHYDFSLQRPACYVPTEDEPQQIGKAQALKGEALPARQMSLVYLAKAYFAVLELLIHAVELLNEPEEKSKMLRLLEQAKRE
jgi:hypothetical protein